jgi:hypothetical protein
MSCETNCVTALIFPNSLDVTEGDDLLLASACSNHDAAKDPSSPYSLQKLRFDL